MLGIIPVPTSRCFFLPWMVLQRQNLRINKQKGGRKCMAVLQFFLAKKSTRKRFLTTWESEKSLLRGFVKYNNTVCSKIELPHIFHDFFSRRGVTASLWIMVSPFLISLFRPDVCLQFAPEKHTHTCHVCIEYRRTVLTLGLQYWKSQQTCELHYVKVTIAEPP